MFRRRTVDIIVISESYFCLDITFQHAKVRLDLRVASSIRSAFRDSESEINQTWF